jgi:hypothetical protein
MKNNKYHTVGPILKYHTVGPILKYHTVGPILKYHTVGPILKSKRKSVEILRGKIDILNWSKTTYESVNNYYYFVLSYPTDIFWWFL